MEEGVPYQTFIASILHKYVTGRLTESAAPVSSRAERRATRRRTASAK
jgi:hypothetical protein